MKPKHKFPSYEALPAVQSHPEFDAVLLDLPLTDVMKILVRTGLDGGCLATISQKLSHLHPNMNELMVQHILYHNHELYLAFLTARKQFFEIHSSSPIPRDLDPKDAVMLKSWQIHCMTQNKIVAEAIDKLRIHSGGMTSEVRDELDEFFDRAEKNRSTQDSIQPKELH